MKVFAKQMRLFYDNTVISWHEHVREEKPGELNFQHCERFIESCEEAGIDKALCSRPFPSDPLCPPEIFRRLNDVVSAGMKCYPDKILGMCFVNPGYIDEAIYEVERCVLELGMIGVKLYHQYFINEPVLFKLVEKCIDLDIPILMHAGKVCDEMNIKIQPRVSNGVHFAKIAKRYPEASFVMAHIGGGGDWQWSLKAIQNSPNVFIDISGSVYDRPMIEEAVNYLGAERVLFGTDGMFSSCIGKILGADISDGDKRTILKGTAFLHYLNKKGIIV